MRHSLFLGAALLLCAAASAKAQPVSSSYATHDGRAGTVVIACPSQDGSFTADACSLAKNAPVTFAGPGTAAIVTANAAVTVFAAGVVATGCDFVNTGSAVLYLDFHHGRLCRQRDIDPVATRPILPLPLRSARRRFRGRVPTAILRQHSLLTRGT